MRGLFKPRRDWLRRTYQGGGTGPQTNAVLLENIAAGQQGGSLAFGLDNHNGFNPDHPRAKHDIGVTGVAVFHMDDIGAVFNGIDLGTFNASMTTNPTAMFNLACYLAVAAQRNVPRASLTGTVQNDMMKEFGVRRTFVFPPEPSLRMAADIVEFCTLEMPRWNGMNGCHYHWGEAGATPSQSVAYTMVAVSEVLNRLRNRPRIDADLLAKIFGRISFFVRTETDLPGQVAMLKSLARFWAFLGKEEYGVSDPAALQCRFGAQVDSLNLVPGDPLMNWLHIALSALPLIASSEVAARAIQLPCATEPEGLPTPGDQQQALRIQMALAQWTGFLRHSCDFFDGPAMEALVATILDPAKEEYARLMALPSVDDRVRAIKEGLARSLGERQAQIETGDLRLSLTDSPEKRPSEVLRADPNVRRDAIERLKAILARRNNEAVADAVTELQRAAKEGDNLMPPTIALVERDGTLGDWTAALETVWGAYKPETPIIIRGLSPDTEAMRALQARVAEVKEELGVAEILFLVSTVGLDGHNNGMRTFAQRATDAGIRVEALEGIGYEAQELAQLAVDRNVAALALSAFSGAQKTFIPEVMAKLHDLRALHIVVAVGGTLPLEDQALLQGAGVKCIYPTSAKPNFTTVVADMVEKVREACRLK